jgi:hypothetical protein
MTAPAEKSENCISGDPPSSQLLLPPGAEDLRLRPAQLARLVGLSRQGVHDHIKRGNVTLDADGRLPLARALRQLYDNVDPARRRPRGPLALAAQREAAVLRAEIERLEKEVDAMRVKLAAPRAEIARAVQAAINGVGDDYAVKIGTLCNMIVDGFAGLMDANAAGQLDDALDVLVDKAIYNSSNVDDGAPDPPVAMQ